SDAPPGAGENLDLAEDLVRLQRRGGADEDQFAGAAERPGADRFPVVAGAVADAIEKDLEAVGLQVTRQGGGIDLRVAPGIGDEEIVAEDEIKTAPQEGTLRCIAGVRGGKRGCCRHGHERASPSGGAIMSRVWGLAKSITRLNGRIRPPIVCRYPAPAAETSVPLRPRCPPGRRDCAGQP